MLGSHQGRCDKRKGLGAVGMLRRGKRRLELKPPGTNPCAHDLRSSTRLTTETASALSTLPSQEHKGIPAGFVLETGSCGISEGCATGIGKIPSKQHSNKCL